MRIIDIHQLMWMNEWMRLKLKNFPFYWILANNCIHLCAQFSWCRFPVLENEIKKLREGLSSCLLNVIIASRHGHCNALHLCKSYAVKVYGGVRVRSAIFVIRDLLAIHRHITHHAYNGSIHHTVRCTSSSSCSFINNNISFRLNILLGHFRLALSGKRLQSKDT